MTSEQQKKSRRSRAVRMAGPLVILLAGAAFVVFAAGLSDKPRSVPSPEQPAANVNVQTVQARDRFAETFVLPGVVEPVLTVKVAAEVPGRIDRLEVDEGRTVKQGQTLLRLNTELLKADYDQAKAQAEFDQREQKRITDLRQRNVATEMEFDQVITKAAASRATLESAKARLDRATIVAPISGVLNRLPVKAGEYVQPGQCAAEIVDVSKVKVVVDVPERDVPFIKVGAEEEVTLPFRDQTVKGTVTYVSALANDQSRTTRVEITVDNQDRLLHSGLIVSARLVRRVLDQVVLIPLRAVVPLEQGKAVYVVEGGKAQSRQVRLGSFKGSSVQVIEGLKPGEILIVPGGLVGPGQKVNIVGPAEGDGPALTGAATRPGKMPQGAAEGGLARAGNDPSPTTMPGAVHAAGTGEVDP